MTGIDQGPDRADSGRVLGWLSGVGITVVPWIAAGLLSTIGALVGPESWNPESVFPWALLASFVAMVGWIGYGCLRIRGFRRGGLLGSAIALTVVAAFYALVRILQP